MNNQELLEFINKTWPLGVNTDSDIPKLRFQRDEKLIYGYSLNISRVLDIFFNFIPETLKEKLKSNSITNETFNGIINSTIFLYLTKCLLEFNNKKDRIIVVGHSKNGQPLLFCSDDDLNKELGIKLHTNIDNSCNKTALESNKNTPFIKLLIDYFYDGFNHEFGMPFVMIRENPRVNILGSDLSSSIDLNQSKLGFLEYFQIELKTFYEHRKDYYDLIAETLLKNFPIGLKIFYELRKDNIGLIVETCKNEISEEYKKGDYVYALLNKTDSPGTKYNLKFWADGEQFPQNLYGSNLIFTNLFNPSQEDFGYVLDYMLIDDKIIYLNDFDLNKYYEHNLELINKICELSLNTETYKNKFVLCQNQIVTLLKEKEIITDFKLNKVLDN